MRFGGLQWRGLLALVVIVLIYQLWIFLHICWWVNHNPDTTAFMEDRLEQIQEKTPDATLKH